MNLFNIDRFKASVRQYVFKHAETTVTTEESTQGLIKGETALAKSSIYAGVQWPQYNPDDLMSRKGYGIYKQMLLDDQIKVVTKFRRNAVTSRTGIFELETDKLSETEIEFRINLFTEILRRMHGTFKKKLDAIMTSMQYGFSLSEKVFKQMEYEGKTYYGIDDIKLKPFETFFFYTDKYGNLIKLEQEINGEIIPNLDYNKFIHHVHNQEVDEFYGSSELREAYRDWFSKDITYRLHNIWLERCASGFVVMKPGPDKVIQKGTAEYNEIVDIINNIKTNTAMLLPSGVEAEVISFQDTEAYSRALDRYDRAISKSLLMPNLLGFTADNKNGSRSLGETQLEAFLWMLDSEADDLEETVNEQLFDQLGDINFGDGLYPQYRMQPLSNSQKFKILEEWGELITKGAVQRSDSDEDHVRELLEFPEKDEASVAEPVVADNPNNPANEEKGKEKEPKKKDDKDFDKTKPDETIIGTKPGLKTGFTKAVKRVDFVAIDQSSNIVAFESVNEIATALTKGVIDVVNDLDGIDTQDPKATSKLQFKPSVSKEIRRGFTKTLKEGWRIGNINGRQELRTSLGKDEALFSQFKFARLEDIAARFFTADSFKMTGDLTGAALSIIKGEILNGIKYSKTLNEVKKSIFQALGTAGMLDEELTLQALGEALGVADPTHRIKTTVRTKTFEAINEARFNLFTDPELGGFVEALEYSAILDSRVTQICSELHGKVYPLTSDEWEKYRPPNHFNCRSVLIPITTRDIWSTSTQPTIDPQKGFA